MSQSVFLILQQLHFRSAFSKTLQKHLMKLSLRAVLRDGSCCLSWFRGRWTEKERSMAWFKVTKSSVSGLGVSTLVSFSWTKAFKPRLSNLLFQSEIVQKVEQHHLGLIC